MELLPLSLSLFFWHLFTFYHEISLGCYLTSQGQERRIPFLSLPTVPSTVLDKIAEHQLQHWFGKYGPYLIDSMFSFSMPRPPHPHSNFQAPFSRLRFYSVHPYSWSGNNVFFADHDLCTFQTSIIISLTGKMETARLPKYFAFSARK